MGNYTCGGCGKPVTQGTVYYDSNQPVHMVGTANTALFELMAPNSCLHRYGFKDEKTRVTLKGEVMSFSTFEELVIQQARELQKK